MSDAVTSDAPTKSLATALPTTLGGQFRRHLPAYAAGTLCLAAFQFAMNRIDWSAKAAIDRIFAERPTDAVPAALAMLGLAVVAFTTRVLSRWFMFNAGRDAEYELRQLLLWRLHRLGAAFYRKMNAGEIMSRSSGDLLQVRLLLGFGVLNIANVIFAFGSALQVMLRVSVRLSISAIIVMPILIPAVRAFGKAMYKYTRENQVTLGKLTQVLQSNLTGVRVVRSFALERLELERFRAANKRYLEASLGFARVRGFMGPLIGAAASLSVLACFAYGGHLLVNEVITPGDFFAFWLALGRLTWPMIAIGFALAIIQRGRAGFSRLKEVLDAEPEIVDGTDAAPEKFYGGLQVRGLSFAYGERVVLDNVSFDLRAGESVAIVGRTGAGKSTLAMLLARLLPTPEGTVFFDDRDVCSLPLLAIRGAIGYAQQDAFLFSTTVTDNIGYSLDEVESAAAVEKIRDAAREAHVLEEALALPDGFDTVVGERGVQLSGGQKQRLALARALVREPAVLVLDDPLSAVDAKTETQILRAIERQTKARTVVLITHRVAAASRCDTVIVLDAGRVVDRGTHAELVERGGIYAQFAEEQSVSSELEAMEPASVPALPVAAPSAPNGALQ